MASQMKKTENLAFYVGRISHSFLGLLECLLADAQLDKRVSPGMGLVLLALYERDNRIIKEISQRTQLRSSTLTSLLSRMQKGGLVRCKKDYQDGRAVRVRLTNLAKTIRPRVFSLHRRLNQIMTTNLSKGEVRATKDSLLKIIESMRCEKARHRRRVRYERRGKPVFLEMKRGLHPFHPDPST